jgi:hypothetical protein
LPPLFFGGGKDPSPESIATTGIMDSGLRQEAHPARGQTTPVRSNHGWSGLSAVVKEQRRKRYPSIAVCVGDGFREGLYPSYVLTSCKTPRNGRWGRTCADA